MAAPLAAVAAGAGKALLRARVALRYVRVARALNRRRSRRRRWWLAGIVGMIFLPFLAVIALTMTALVFILLPFMRFDHLPSADALAEIPSRVLVAYDNAASAHCADTPVNWPVIAAIGYIESRHGTVGGRHVRDDFTIGPTPILGPVLDGTIPGTRARPIGPWAGEYGLPPDATHQQALGPMQFLPGTWQTTVDTHELQGKDPHNLEHAAQAVAAKLCEAVRRHGETHDDPRDAVRAALLGYNNSIMYGATVIAKALLLDAGDLSDPEGTTAYQLEFLEDTLSFVAIDELLEGPPEAPIESESLSSRELRITAFGSEHIHADNASTKLLTLILATWFNSNISGAYLCSPAADVHYNAFPNMREDHETMAGVPCEDEIRLVLDQGIFDHEAA